MKMSLASCCNVLNFNGAEKGKKSLPVKIAPKTKCPIEAGAMPNQPGTIIKNINYI